MAWGDEDDGLGVGEDVVLNILGRLPARFFSFAACVCRSWRRLCNQILSRPKLLSALSLNPRPRVAIDEAFEKVLSKPIRPHFFIACIGNKFGLKRTHQLLKARVGTTIPLITCLAPGIIGSDACTNELKEVKWTSLDSHGSYYNSSSRANHGILLITGFVPGIKVGLIPLFKGHKEASRESTVDLFLNDIKNYTASVSDCNSPAAIVMFSDHKSSVRDVLERMDCSLSRETVIAGYLAGGDDKGCFLFSGGDGCKTTAGGSRELCVSSPSSTSTNQCNHTRGSIDQISLFGAVALVFVKDRDKSPGIGEIHFHLSLSTGLSPIGTTYKAASVRVTKPGTSECLTWLTARRDGSLLELGGQSILNDLENEVGDDNLIYIGVLKQRKQKFKKGKLISSYAFHEYSGVDEEYLFVDGEGIRTGDPFRFFTPNIETAWESHNTVLEELRALKLQNQTEVFGGLILACFCRGESFFGSLNVDSSAFSDNFPDASLAGMFCLGEIARPSCGQEGKELECVSNFLNFCSTVYLVMSYTPKP